MASSGKDHDPGRRLPLPFDMDVPGQWSLRPEQAAFVIPEPAPNTRAHPYRGLSVQDTEVPLTTSHLLPWLEGREVYRRTEYLALRRGEETALVAVRKASLEPLFSPVVEARLLAEPHEVVAVSAPDVDVGNGTALAATARAHARPGARAYVVTGRHEHVNFIWEPSPVTVRVIEVRPPDPPKLYEQAQRVVQFDEDLPPVNLALDTVSIPELAAAHPAATYLLPCRGSGIELPGAVAFLDTRPAQRAEWVLIGCERSVQFHQHFYGDTPPQVDLCPLRRAEATTGHEPVVVKCCLRERGVDVTDGIATVPWGASLDEVREALRRLTGTDHHSAVSSGSTHAGG